MSRVGFIGTGDIATPMIRYLARRGHEIWVSERSRDVSTALAAEFANVNVADNQRVLDRSDIVFLCLRPKVWADVISTLDFRADQDVVSVMSGASLEALGQVCAPATRISVTIPLAALEEGGCPLPVYPATSPVAALFGDDNPVLAQGSEADINTHFAASTMLSAVLGTMKDGAEWLGQETGNADGAETYVTALVRATLRDVPLGAGHLLAARDALATEGTLNLQMVNGLAAGSVSETLTTTLTAIQTRVKGSS